MDGSADVSLVMPGPLVPPMCDLRAVGPGTADTTRHPRVRLS